MSRGSAAGNIITLLLLVGVIGLGVWLWLGRNAARACRSRAGPNAAGEDRRAAWRSPMATRRSRSSPCTGTPTLEAANAFVPKDGDIRIDISEYAGYGGLIVANGGLEPNARIHSSPRSTDSRSRSR